MLRWRKSWVIENIQGSIRRDLEPGERSVWSDLLDLCAMSRRWGIIERSQGIPYSFEELSQMFVTPLDVVNSAIDKCIKEGRLVYNPDGSITVTHWDKYQANNKKTGNKDIPLNVEDKKASQQAAAARLAYLEPEAAQRGINNRNIEEFVKNRSKEDG